MTNKTRNSITFEFNSHQRTYTLVQNTCLDRLLTNIHLIGNVSG